MIRKCIFTILVLIISTALSSEVFKTTVIDNSNYSDLTENYNDNYYYSMNASEPLIPVRIEYIAVKGIADIDSFHYRVIQTDTLENTPIPGEDPLPRQYKSPKRSVLKEIKSLYPGSIINVKKGYSGNSTQITAGIAVFQTDGSKLYHHRKVNLEIFYTVKNSPAQKSANTVLIITEDSLKAAWGGYSEIYRDFDVRIRSIGDFIGSYDNSDTSLSLRQYAQSMYADSGLRAMILGLDTDAIPGVYVNMWLTEQVDSSSCDVITDKYYSCLDGDWNKDGDAYVGEMEDSIDIYPDILLARCPLESSSAISHFLDKIDAFKSGTGDTVLLAASYLDADTDGSIGMEMMIENIPFEEPLVRLYENTGNLSSVSFINAVDNSPFAVVHDGHGGPSAIQTGTDYTYNSDIDNLNNTMPAMMYSLSCFSAAYDYDCLAEHFLNGPGGGFYIGNSRYGWYTPYFPGFGTGDILMESFFEYFINKQNNPCSALNSVFGKYAHQITGFNDYRWAFMALTYFGDPLINIEREIDCISTNVQMPVNNRYFTLTVPVKDSVIVRCEGDSVFSSVLYPSDNLFSSPVYSEDSITVEISAGNYIDTVMIFTDESSAKPFITRYQFNFTGSDTLLLDMDISVDSADTYKIKPGNITDTLIYQGSDTLFTLDKDTSLTMEYFVQNTPENNSLLPIEIEGETLMIQTGLNLMKNTDIKLHLESALFNLSDTVFTQYEIINRSARDVIAAISMQSDSFSSSSIIYNDTLNAFTSHILNDTLICPQTDEADISLIVSGDSQSYTKTYMLALNSSERINDSECPEDNYTVDSTAAYFHRTTKRYNSGTYSYFSGYTSSSTYPANYITTLTSPFFNYSGTDIFGFSTFFDVEAGFDYCVVSMHSDSADIPLATLSGSSKDWQDYVFRAEEYPVENNEKAYLRFSFYSENDVYQNEGWYIDDIVLPGSVIQTGFGSDLPGNRDNAIIYSLSDSRLTVSSNRESVLEIFDVTGRKISHNIIQPGRHSRELGFAAGIYFIRLSSHGRQLSRKIIKLK